jgi:hypothetical protein
MTLQPRYLEYIRPDAQDQIRASKALDHPHRCACSTCTLFARLGKVVRQQEQGR